MKTKNLNKILILFLFLTISWSGFGQTLSTYSFTQSTGTYTAFSDGTLILNNIDDGVSAVLNIGFTYNYNGSSFTQCIASSNGFIVLGSTAPGTTLLTPISTTSSINSISPFARDGRTSGGVRYKTIGSSPNRFFIIQYTTYRPQYNNTSNTVNFQIQLSESDGSVAFIYHGAIYNTTTYTAQIGLRGTTAANDYRNRTGTTWATSTEGTANTQTMSWNNVSDGHPANGQMYKWTPPAPCSGTPLAGTAAIGSSSGCFGGTVTLSSSGLSSATGISYQWQSSPNGTTWSNIAGATSGTYALTTSLGINYYRIATTCSGSGLTNYSNNVTFTGIACVPNSGNNSISTCSEHIYDHAGPSSNYSPGANGYTVINPSTPGNLIQLTGSYFTESGYDIVTIFNGIGTGGTVLYTGSSNSAVSIPTISSSDASGALTVRFTSDGSIEHTGFDFAIQCVTMCSGTPNAGSASAEFASTCEGNSLDVTGIGLSTEFGVTYQWQTSTDGTTWNNISGATAAVQTVTPVMGNNWYRIVSTCSVSGLSNNSSSTLVTVASNTLLAPDIAAYPSTIMEGETSTLTGGFTGGTLTWYTGGCYGTQIGTGTPFDVTPTITTTYFASVMNGGCISACDTVTVIVAQPCAVEATANNIYDTLNICSGTSVDIAATGGCNYLMDNSFNDGTMGVGWASNANPQFNNPCVASLDGTSYLWIGDAATFPRDLVTQAYTVTDDCEICFDFVMATQGNATPCEGPDEEDEGVSIQWSIDNGASWFDITYFSPNGTQYPSNSFVGSGTSVAQNITSDFVSWGNYCFDVPIAAASVQTKFRFHQEQVTDFIYDHWGLDNVEITCPTEGQTVQWSNGPTVLDPVANVTPGASTTYTVIIDDGTGFGNGDTASVYVHIIGTPNVTDDHACTVGSSVTMTASGMGTLQWYDAATGGTLVNTGATYNIPSLMSADSFYVEEVATAFPTINYTFDGGMQGWTSSHTCSGSNNWTWNSDGGVGTLYAADPSGYSAQLVQSPIIDVSTWNGTLTFSYTHRYSTESNYDEGIVAYRLDGGAWQYFTPNVGAYNSVTSIESNPINACTTNSLNSYNGTLATYTTHSGAIDVSTANTLELAFSFTSDGSVGGTGWYINHVSLAGGGASTCPTNRAVVYAGISDLHSDYSDVPVSCYGNNDGEVTAMIVDALGIPVPGIYTFSWANGSSTATLLGKASGTYPVTITDSYGCETNTNAIIAGPPVPTAIVSGSGVSGDCNIVSPDEWVHIVNSSNNDEVIASVFDATGGTDLYLTEASATIYGAVQYNNSQPYLQRVVTVTPALQGAATVRIYFTNAEYSALLTADPTITGLSDLTVTKCDDGTFNNCLLMNTSTFGVSPIGSGYYTEVPVSSFSSFYIHKNNGFPLPVELSSFEATCEDNYTQIEWSTSSEINNAYFVIERSTDNKNYEYVAEIKGAGNSNEKTQYAYADYSAPQTQVYYRLLQVDFDGKFEYHKAISSNCYASKDHGFVAYQSKKQTISIKTSLTKGEYSLSVIDQIGRVVYNSNINVETDGQIFNCFDNDFLTGMFQVNIYNSQNKWTEKVITKP